MEAPPSAVASLRATSGQEACDLQDAVGLMLRPGQGSLVLEDDPHTDPRARRQLQRALDLSVSAARYGVARAGLGEEQVAQLVRTAIPETPGVLEALRRGSPEEVTATLEQSVRDCLHTLLPHADPAKVDEGLQAVRRYLPYVSGTLLGVTRALGWQGTADQNQPAALEELATEGENLPALETLLDSHK